MRAITVAKLSAINANLLVVLEAVLEERSVKRASERLGLSQPAVSNQLAKLRGLLDDELIVRVGSSMQLTPRAESFLPRLQAGVAAFQSVLDDPEAFSPARCDARFRVAMIDLAEASIVARLVERLGQEAPQASLQVYSAGVLEVSAGLADGTVDALVGIVESAGLGDGFYEKPLFETRLVPIARRGHPEVPAEGARRADSARRDVLGPVPPARPPSMSLAAYAALDHVVVTSRADGRGNIDDLLSAAGLARRVRLRVPRAVLVPPLIASSDLVAAVDAPALLAYGDALPLVRFEVEGLELPAGAVSLVWHERTHKDPARRYLRRLIREVSQQTVEARDLSRVRASG